jgi:hypothetical protein
MHVYHLPILYCLPRGSQDCPEVVFGAGNRPLKCVVSTLDRQVEAGCRWVVNLRR